MNRVRAATFGLMATLTSALPTGAYAGATPSEAEQARDNAMIACMFASMAMESVAEQLAYRQDAVASVEGRKAYIKEVEALFGQLISSTPDLQTVVLSSFDAGLKSYESSQKVLRTAGVAQSDATKAERRSWFEAAREVERVCLFRLGEISGQGRLDEVVRRR